MIERDPQDVYWRVGGRSARHAAPPPVRGPAKKPPRRRKSASAAERERQAERMAAYAASVRGYERGDGDMRTRLGSEMVTHVEAVQRWLAYFAREGIEPDPPAPAWATADAQC